MQILNTMSSKDDTKKDGDEAAAKLAKKWKEVNNIIKETIYTEAAYVKSLRNLQENFYQKLKAKVDKEDQILTEGEIGVIFGNIETLLPLHEKMLHDLEERQKTQPGDIGSTIAEFSPYLKMYTAYLNNNSAAQQLIAEIKKRKNSSFAQFCAEVKGESLSSLMIKPAQRIPRYRMLLENLLKYMPETETEKRKHLAKALDAVRTAADHCDQHIAKTMEYAKANALQQRFLEKIPVNLKRQLLLEEKMYKKNRKGFLQSRIFILFTDCLLYCKSSVTLAEHKTHLFPLTLRDIDVAKESEHRVEENYQPFEIRAAQKSYIVYAENLDQKTKWMKAIEKSVEEHINNRLTIINRGPRDDNRVSAPSEWQDTEICQLCHKRFMKVFRPRHHCRMCGKCVCRTCSPYTHRINNQSMRICHECNQDLIITKEKEAFEAPVWKSDTIACLICNTVFEKFKIKKTRHHCRNCGNCVCRSCSNYRWSLPNDPVGKDSRVCIRCYKKLEGGAKPGLTSIGEDEPVVAPVVKATRSAPALMPRDDSDDIEDDDDDAEEETDETPPLLPRRGSDAPPKGSDVASPR